MKYDVARDVIAESRDAARRTAEQADDGPPIWDPPHGQDRSPTGTEQLAKSVRRATFCIEVSHMIYGYDCRTVNEYGLKQLREISLAVSPDNLRDMAAFLLDTANELEGAASAHWHRHMPDTLRRKVGCEVIVLNSKLEDCT